MHMSCSGHQCHPQCLLDLCQSLVEVSPSLVEPREMKVDIWINRDHVAGLPEDLGTTLVVARGYQVVSQREVARWLSRG